MKTLIVYDATILAGGFRSGIYFAAWNILLALLRRPDVKMRLYYSPGCPSAAVVEFERRLLEAVGTGRAWRYTGESIGREHSSKHVAVRTLHLYARCMRARPRLKRWCLLPLKMACKLSLWLMGHRCPVVEPCANDVFLSPLFAVPPDWRVSSARKCLVLYDLMPKLFPQFYPPLDSADATWYRVMLESLNTEDRYFAISSATRQDFLRFFPHLKREQITVIPLAADVRTFHREESAEKVDAVLRKYGIPAGTPYLLSLCSIDPRKNLIHMVKAFLRFVKENNVADLKFVLVGGSYDDKMHHSVREELDRLAAESGRIVLTGYVPDEELSAFYSGARIFLYVSLYEGFGLPPLEAMQCGCPVITSDNSSLPEVVGDAAVMVNATDQDALVAALRDLHVDSVRREDLARRGLARAKMFNWDRTAEIICAEIARPA